MGYPLNRLDEPAFMAGPKPMQTEFDIHLRLGSGWEALILVEKCLVFIGHHCILFRKTLPDNNIHSQLMKTSSIMFTSPYDGNKDMEGI